MSSHLAPSHLLALIESLRTAVDDIRARADRLSGDLATRSARERQRCDLAVQEYARRLETDLAQADDLFRQHQVATEAAYEGRKKWINRAYQTSKEQRLNEIENQVGASKYQAQKQSLQAERDRDAQLTAANQALQTFQQSLAAEQARLAEAEGTAQSSFKGYSGLTSRFFAAYEQAPAETVTDEHELLRKLQELLKEAAKQQDRFNGNLLLRLFRYWILWVVLFGATVGLVPVLQKAGHTAFTWPVGGAIAGAGIVLVLVLRFLGLRAATPVAASLSSTLARARRTHDAAADHAQKHHAAEHERIKAEFVATATAFDQQLKRVTTTAGQTRVALRMKTDERTVRINTRHEQLHARRVKRLQAEYTAAREALRNNSARAQQDTRNVCEQTIQGFKAATEAEWQKLETEWNERVLPVFAEVEQLNAEAAQLFPSWEELTSRPWNPPALFTHSAKFGALTVDVEKLSQPPKEKRLSFPRSAFSAPLCLTYPDEGSVVFETKLTGQKQAIEAINSIILRLLAASPPGRLNFTIIDPVGLGQNFAGVMHMADYEEQIISNRIWTQSTQIEQKLADLNEHMEKVIQMYLRNEYKDIAEYNRQAGVIAEKYHFLVVADFPAGFSDTAGKRLMSIAASGARCGVYTLLHWDLRQPLPQDFLPEELRKTSVCISATNSGFAFTGRALPGTGVLLDAAPAPEQLTAFVHQVGLRSRDSSRVEVPFEHIAPPPDQVWTAETSKELRVAIGRTGATKLQYLEIGKGTAQHGLVAGKTGSGKSTLFHVIITNLALWSSPEDVEFYLVDFKKGVEFKCYGSRRLPHARVVAIESDREFGLSVLQRVDDELKRRGDLFRQLGVQDLPGYKRAGGTPRLPRTLLMIDEFQEFFVEDDKVAQTASLLLDRIVRQGRAFGIHVLLGSQTLGGAYTVARTTLGQMVIRIALQCNEADAYLIMDDSNPAPRLLSRPGEGIYNDSAGAVEGNSPFQVVWLPEQVRDDYLEKIRTRADQSGIDYPGPIVFEGNAPAEVRENLALAKVLSTAPAVPPVAARIWLGAPNSIKGPTEVVFHRQSGNNLLVVGQRDEAILAILALGVVALAAQYPPGTASILVCDTTTPGTPHRDFLDSVLQTVPHNLTRVRPADLDKVMAELNAEMTRRAEDPDAEHAPPRFLFIHGLHKLARLRHEDDFGFTASDEGEAPKPGAVLNRMLTEGTRLGFHVIATIDTYNNVNRALSRKALSEFEMRILFQMSVNDSASLIESPKASNLGLHRALFYNSQEGYLETFRPYALPDSQWIRELAARIAKTPSTAASS